MFSEPKDIFPESQDTIDADSHEALSAMNDDDKLPSSTVYRGTTGDPIFGLLLAIAISIGLTPLLPDAADLRYTLSWLVLTGFSVLVWLLGSMVRIKEETPENLIWGVVFGLLLSIPFLIFGGDILADTTRLIFINMSIGTVLAYLLFVMPIAESLFFRGVMQEHLSWLVAASLATVWHVIIFFPVFWQDVLSAPIVALVIATVLFMSNLLYSYVRDRNGLAAAWIAQLVVNLLMIFLPFL